MHWRYLRDGDAVFDWPGRGGRRKELLSFQQEYILLRELRREIWPNQYIDAATVRKAYEKAIGHGVPPSTVYRMLARHGWTKAPVLKAPTGTHLRDTSYFTKESSPVDQTRTPVDHWLLERKLTVKNSRR